MDINYISPTDEMQTEALDKYTKWLDGQLAFANVDKALTKQKFEEK